MEKDEYAGGPFIRLFAERKSLSKVLLKSYQVRGAGTGKRYNSHSEKFFKFCRERYPVIPFKQPLAHRLEIAILFKLLI